MKSTQYCGLAILVAGIWGTTLQLPAADSYLGAEAVLQKIKEKQGAPPEPEKKADPQAALRKQLADYKAKVSTLSPSDAAKGWLELFDKIAKAKPPEPFNRVRTPNQETPLDMSSIMEVLPPPAAWAELEKAVLARPAAKGKDLSKEQGLKLLAYTLTGNNAARQGLIKEMEKQAKGAEGSEAYVYQSLFSTLKRALLASIDDPKVVLQMVEQEIAEAQGEYGSEEVELPNLVVVVGEKETEALLRKALVAPKVKLEVPNGTATQKLAQKLALELVNDLKTPQWALVSSLDTVDLYEAMDKKFSVKKEETATPSVPGLINLPRVPRFSNDYRKTQADLYYLLGLIAKGRTQDAIKVATAAGKENGVSLPDEAITAMEKAGYSRAMADFFYELLKDNPGLTFWNSYVEISANVGQTERMLELARQAAAKTDLPARKRAYIANVLVSALLAADKVDEGVEQLRKIAAAPAAEGDDNDEENMMMAMMMGRGGAGEQLARIGQLMNRPEWIEEGLKMARASAAQAAKRNQGYSYQNAEIQLAGLLAELGRGQEAEKAIMDYLVSQATKPKQPEYGTSGQERQALLLLATIYHKADRHEDVVTLFDEAPWWQAKDVKEFYVQSGKDEFSHFHEQSMPSGFILAQALIKTGHADKAQPIADALLNHLPGSDRGYELLLQLDPANASTRLDQLFARDQYEERPLIWKGKLLLDAGKVDDAEIVIRKAVSIDPSDGEQGPNDRMRVYTVLADIREKKGDKKEADLFRGAVRAIRMSEQADQFVKAGLLKRAVQMYQDSLKHFADAYCIQSRLALQLSEMGLHEEAEVYYRKAYELMPDSFGRVESHCFGCERAFAGERAQGIAEKVFTRLAAERPDQPQVHYLLGYLRHAQDRHDEALPHFQKAVELDPQYLNAWVKLQETMDHVRRPLTEQDKVSLEILRLDPLGRHAHADLANLIDLRALWNIVEKSQALRPKQPNALYELAASRKQMEEDAKKATNTRNSYSYVSYRSSGRDNSLSPVAALQQVAFVQAAIQLLGARGSMYW